MQVLYWGPALRRNLEGNEKALEEGTWLSEDAVSAGIRPRPNPLGSSGTWIVSQSKPWDKGVSLMYVLLVTGCRLTTRVWVRQIHWPITFLFEGYSCKLFTSRIPWKPHLPVYNFVSYTSIKLGKVKEINLKQKQSKVKRQDTNHMKILMMHITKDLYHKYTRKFQR